MSFYMIFANVAVFINFTFKFRDIIVMLNCQLPTAAAASSVCHTSRTKSKENFDFCFELRGDPCVMITTLN